MTYRLSLKLDHHTFTPPRSTYGFHLPRFTVLKCYAVVNPNTQPVKVRRGWPGHHRLLILSPERVVEGAHVSPYEIVTRWLASQSDAKAVVSAPPGKRPLHDARRLGRQFAKYQPAYPTSREASHAHARHPNQQRFIHDVVLDFVCEISCLGG